MGRSLTSLGTGAGRSASGAGSVGGWLAGTRRGLAGVCGERRSEECGLAAHAAPQLYSSSSRGASISGPKRGSSGAASGGTSMGMTGATGTMGSAGAIGAAGAMGAKGGAGVMGSAGAVGATGVTAGVFCVGSSSKVSDSGSAPTGIAGRAGATGAGEGGMLAHSGAGRYGAALDGCAGSGAALGG